MATVVEGEMLMACARMISVAATIHNDVSLTLSTIEDTGGQISQFRATVAYNIFSPPPPFLLITATANSDYSPLSSTLLIFPAGSANGTVMCAPITVADDQLVECEEYFAIVLHLVTSIGSCLGLGNNETAVTIADSDCMCLA